MPQQPFKVGIVVLAYHRPEQLACLLESLRHPRVTVYLHIDSGVRIEPFRAALSRAAVGEVVWLPRHRSGWATVGIVDAETEGIAAAVAGGCAYVLVISGEDFPLKPVAEIVDFARANRQRSFVQSFALPYAAWPLNGRERTDFYTCTVAGRRYTCVPRGEDTSSLTRARRALNWALRARFMLAPPRRFPAYLRPYGGQQWLNLTRAAAAYVIDFIARHPDYRSYHVHTACPDEIFIHSILLGTHFADEHEIVDDDLRFLLWRGGDHPQTLRLEHLPAMLASTDLFARKIVAQEDPRLFAALREHAGAAGPAAAAAGLRGDPDLPRPAGSAG